MELIEQQLDIEELFVDGMYSRTGFLQKGTLAVGHIHKNRVINILSQGSLLVKTNDEEEGIIIHAPKIFVTEPGSRKSVYAIVDVTFTNILRTDKTTTKEVEEEVVVPHNGILPYMKRKEIT